MMKVISQPFSYLLKFQCVISFKIAQISFRLSLFSKIAYFISFKFIPQRSAVQLGERAQSKLVFFSVESSYGNSEIRYYTLLRFLQRHIINISFLKHKSLFHSAYKFHIQLDSIKNFYNFPLFYVFSIWLINISQYIVQLYIFFYFTVLIILNIYFMNTDQPQTIAPTAITFVYSAQQQKGVLPKQANNINFSKKICCERCNNVGMTSIRYEAGLNAVLWSIFLFPCGLIACCTPSCLNVVHSCSTCNSYAGKYEKKCCN